MAEAPGLALGVRLSLFDSLPYTKGPDGVEGAQTQQVITAVLHHVNGQVIASQNQKVGPETITQCQAIPFPHPV